MRKPFYELIIIIIIIIIIITILFQFLQYFGLPTDKHRVVTVVDLHHSIHMIYIYKSFNS